jgi:hypothetical protein
LLRFFRISGHSLRPGLRDGDIVLAITAPRLWRLRPGARVIFRQPSYGLLVKKIDHLLPDGRLFVVGAAPSSVDSYEFGPITPNEIIGTVLIIFHRKDAKHAKELNIEEKKR